ncbi:hypothetical protein FB451DRAFT_1396669 [Mycena latifolia]|nr:hypothetical protein FB451DRAFT_1396669 [Mycena latifolia]
MAVLPRDAGCCHVPIKTAHGIARETVDEASTLWVVSWVFAPTASDASLALITTGSLGSLPSLLHTLQLVIGDVLASPRRLGLLIAVWFYAALLVVYTAALFPMTTHPSTGLWRSAQSAVHSFANAQVSWYACSAMPFSDVVH